MIKINFHQPFFYLLLLLGLIVTSGCDKTEIDSDPTAKFTPDLLVGKLSLAMVKGGTQEVSVTALDDEAKPEDFTVTSNDAGIANVIKSGSKFTVTGVNFGKTSLSVVSSSGKSRNIPVNIYNHMVIETDELLITFLYDIEWRYYKHDNGKSSSYWHPADSGGFYPLGTIGGNYWSATGGPQGKTGGMGLKAKEGYNPNNPPIKHPVDYVAIIFCREDAKASFWTPVPPEGYVAMGVVVNFGTNIKPKLTEVVCVRKDLTIKGVAANQSIHIASDTYTTTWPFTDTRVWGTWKIEGPVAGYHENAYLPTGTFVAVNSGTSSNPSRPTDHPVLNVLNIKLPMLTAETPYEEYAPVLTGRETPPEETVPVFSREMLVPATIISDPLSELLTGNIGCGEGWRIVHSPFYRLERQVFWKKVHFVNNTTNTDQGGAYKITQGIEKTESETRWAETGVDISAEAGVSIKGVDAKVATTLSKSFGYEKMVGITQFEYTERSVDLNVSPGKAGAIYQQYTRFLLKRHMDEGKSLEVVRTWDVPAISYTILQYPKD